MPRVLVVIPSWIGDAVMATVALRLLRAAWPGAYIGALVRPGIDELLAGLPTVDEFHLHRSTGLMGPKHAAWHIRPRRYESALLLTNSFSTALVTRLAGIPRRVGYDRDGRGLLLTDRLRAPEREHSSPIARRWRPVPAIAYYYAAALALLGDVAPVLAELESPLSILPPGTRPELPRLESDARAASDILARALVAPGADLVLLNPGANDPAKRWPVDRFALIASRLAERPGTRVLVSGSPSESVLADAIVERAPAALALHRHAHSLAALRGLLRRAALLVTNDTGPRHIAAALGTPTVSLFGPTDPRWTTLPDDDISPSIRREITLVADPTLPPSLVADEHPQRCSMDRIDPDKVLAACQHLLDARSSRAHARS